jgi:hypothetical protein
MEHGGGKGDGSVALQGSCRGCRSTGPGLAPRSSAAPEIWPAYLAPSTRARGSRRGCRWARGSRSVRCRARALHRARASAAAPWCHCRYAGALHCARASAAAPWCPPPRPRRGCWCAGGLPWPGCHAVSAAAPLVEPPRPGGQARAPRISPCPGAFHRPEVRAVVATTTPEVCAAGVLHWPEARLPHCCAHHRTRGSAAAPLAPSKGPRIAPRPGGPHRPELHALVPLPRPGGLTAPEVRALAGIHRAANALHRPEARLLSWWPFAVPWCCRCALA